MANQFFVPFDNNPVSSAQTASSYTVPTGKFAIVTVTLMAEARPTNQSSSGDHKREGAPGSSATTLILRLKTGQALTKTETAASASVTTTTAIGDYAMVSDYSISRVLIDGTVVGEVRASSTSTIYNVTGTSGSTSITGTALVIWNVAEYNNIS